MSISTDIAILVGPKLSMHRCSTHYYAWLVKNCCPAQQSRIHFNLGCIELHIILFHLYLIKYIFVYLLMLFFSLALWSFVQFSCWYTSRYVLLWLHASWSSGTAIETSKNRYDEWTMVPPFHESFTLHSQAFTVCPWNMGDSNSIIRILYFYKHASIDQKVLNY